MNTVDMNTRLNYRFICFCGLFIYLEILFSFWIAVHGRFGSVYCFHFAALQRISFSSGNAKLSRNIRRGSYCKICLWMLCYLHDWENIFFTWQRKKFIFVIYIWTRWSLSLRIGNAVLCPDYCYVIPWILCNLCWIWLILSASTIENMVR